MSNNKKNTKKDTPPPGLSTDENNEQNTTESQTDNSATPTTLANPDPNNFAVKHPLQNKWTMWWDSSMKKLNQHNWSTNVRPLLEFDTVEDFWRLYNNIVTASSLAPGSNYHLFKSGVKPEWEDPQNEKGGKWVINFPTGSRKKSPRDLDECWLNTLLVCIGEGFGDYENEVCGVVISIRKAGDRLALWTRNAEN